MELPWNIMRAVRGRLGLDDDDTSMDDTIKRMTPAQIVRECTAWELGDPGWADRIAEWMLKSGAKPKDFK